MIAFYLVAVFCYGIFSFFYVILFARFFSLSFFVLFLLGLCCFLKKTFVCYILLMKYKLFHWFLFRKSLSFVRKEQAFGASDNASVWSHDKFDSYENEFAEDGEIARVDNNNNNNNNDNDNQSRFYTRRGAAVAGVGGGGAGGSKVLIQNLHANVTKDDVTELMSAFGDLISVRMEFDRSGRPNGTASVIFREHDAATKAIVDCDQRTLDGQVMTVKFATSAGGSGRLSGRLGPRVGEADAGTGGGRLASRRGGFRANASDPTFTVKKKEKKTCCCYGRNILSQQ